ncbi:MAG TPA: protease modulator HflC [Candidatus Acidoferrum sp.]|nr:protease modulator HflC [Candidatus Acidoferrum sp.]
MRRNPLTLVIGILLIIIFGLWLFVFQVRTTEVAVVTTFGNPTRPITEPGAYFKWPWPIQKVWPFDKRVQNFEDKLTERQTRDNFTLLMAVYVGWKITDPAAFFPKFISSDDPIKEAERQLDRLLGNAKAAAIGRHSLSDFVSAAGGGTNFVAIENEILSTLQSQVRSNNYGLEIEFVGVKRLQLPQNVSQSVFDRMTEERKRLAEQLQNEGDAEAQNIRSEANRKAQEVLATARGKATEIKGKALAEATASLSVFKQNPELAIFLLRLNALEGSLKDRSILVFDQNMPPFDLLRGSATNWPAK